MCSPKFYIHQKPQNVTLFGSKAFAGIIIKVKMRSYWIKVSLNPMKLPLQEEDMHTQTHRGGNVRTQAAMGVMQPQAKGVQALLKAPRKRGRGLFPRAFTESVALLTLILDT